MTAYLIQHAFQGSSGLAEDRYINTFHGQNFPEFNTPDFAAIAAAVKRFYVPTTGQGITNYMSDRAMGIGRTIKIYDLSQPKPRVPVYSEISGVAVLSPNTLQSFPEEVALCLSYSAAVVPGNVQARRRGRIYLGPWAVTAGNTTPIGSPSRPVAALRGIITAAAETLSDEMLTAGMKWVVYSPTNDPGGVGPAGSLSVITNVYCDDSWDTQRRRGISPSSRITRAFS